MRRVIFIFTVWYMAIALVRHLKDDDGRLKKEHVGDAKDKYANLSTLKILRFRYRQTGEIVSHLLSPETFPLL